MNANERSQDRPAGSLAGGYGRANIGPSVAAQHESFGDVAAVFFVSSTGRDHVIYALFFRTARRTWSPFPTALAKKGTTPGGCRQLPQGVSGLGSGLLGATHATGLAARTPAALLLDRRA
jgi:hypothetical protein